MNFAHPYVLLLLLLLPVLALHRRMIAVLWIAEECLAGRTELRSQLQKYLEEP